LEVFPKNCFACSRLKDGVLFAGDFFVLPWATANAHVSFCDGLVRVQRTNIVPISNVDRKNPLQT
jgi:hypothetical protein